MVGAVQSLHLQPQSARGLDRHAAARLRSPCPCRSRSRRRRDRDRGQRERRSAHARGLRRRARLFAVAAAGVRPRPEARGDGGRKPGLQGRRARRPRPLHLGADREGLLPDDAGGDQQGGGLARRERARGSFRRRARKARCRRPGGATSRRRCLPAIRKRISAGERKIGHFTDAPAVLEFVNSRDLETLAALGTSCPDHFLRTKIRPLVLAFDPAAGNLDAVDRLARPEPRRLSRRLRRLLSALQARQLAGDARPEPGHLSRARRRHAVLRQGQGDGADRRGILSQRDQRHARRRQASAAMSGSPSRKPSTSNIGCSRRPSCSGCRSRNRSPDGSRWSPAAPAASAGRSPRG